MSSSDSQKEAIPEPHSDDAVSTEDEQQQPAQSDHTTPSTTAMQPPPAPSQQTPQSSAVQSQSHLHPPDISNLSIASSNNRLSTENTGGSASTRRLPPLATVRSVSDTGPPRLAPSPLLTSSQSSGSTSPLASVQAARSASGLGARPPSSSGSAGSGLAGGVSKLPAGMQAKMMAVHPLPRNIPFPSVLPSLRRFITCFHGIPFLPNLFDIAYGSSMPPAVHVVQVPQ